MIRRGRGWSQRCRETCICRGGNYSRKAGGRGGKQSSNPRSFSRAISGSSLFFLDPHPKSLVLSWFSQASFVHVLSEADLSFPVFLWLLDSQPSHLAASEGYRPRDLNYPSKGGMQPRTKRRLLIGSAVLLVIVLGVAIPVGITQSKKGNSSALAAPDAPSTTTESSSSPTSPTTTASSAAPSASASQLAITGRTGSLLRLDNGDEVVYNNTFGGDWVYDPNDPVGAKTGALAGGRAQDWVPRIGETWTWGEDIIHGVRSISLLIPLPLSCLLPSISLTFGLILPFNYLQVNLGQS